MPTKPGPPEQSDPSGITGTSENSGHPKKSGRQKLGTEELACVCSHYDVGVIQKIREYPRGSRKAPKLVLFTDNGIFLLKRRAKGKDDPVKVAFSHAIQLHLAANQFPLPHLVGTRPENNSLLQYKDHIYELFEYIEGKSYDQSPASAHDGGRVLGLYHKLLLNFAAPWEPPRGSYHSSRQVRRAMETVPVTFESDPALKERQNDIKQLVANIRSLYETGAKAANACGLPQWPTQIVHSDWHPGNTLFRDQKVVAVIDYDAARLQQRVTDLANGALQFSIIGGDEDVSKWPEHLDEERTKAFLQGYDEANVIAGPELEAIPYLMSEALIAEAALPIAATGAFGRVEGLAFLFMVERKVRWLQDNAKRLANILED